MNETEYIEVSSCIVVAVILNVVVGACSITAPQACMKILAELIITAKRAIEIVFIGPPLKINPRKRVFF